MAYNPFLSMAEPVPEPTNGEALNPFMMADLEPNPLVAGDNPFATSNPFSDFGGGFEPAAGDTVPMELFGAPDPPGGARLFGIDPPLERLAKPTDLELAPPSRPLPPETQNLILSVTGQMEFTSSHLLDRIPPTRTPSPVSARDIHSPSLTPEPDMESDLLSDPQPQNERPTTAELDINRNRPAPTPPRPPPARPAAPPARPAAPPPRPAPPPVAAPAPGDEINLFDAPAAPPVTRPTKEDILSLYAPPKPEVKQIDFLSDDITDDIPEIPKVSPSPPHDTTAPMECEEQAPIVESAVSPPHPVNVESNPFENFQPNEPTSETFASTNIFTTAEALPTTATFSTTDAFGTTDSTFKITNETTSVNDTFPTTDSFTIADTFATTNAYAADTFITTDTFATTTAPASTEDSFNTPTQFTSSEQAVVINAEPAPAPAAVRGAAPEPEPMAQDPFPAQQDAFDAFAAKFDSTGGGAGEWGAWGDDNASGDGADNGFEAEAFDPFLSMAAPPPPAATPRLRSQGSQDSGDDSFNVVIKPREPSPGSGAVPPPLAPPPRSVVVDTRPNPFDNAEPQAPPPLPQPAEPRRGSGSGTPPTPLFDDDVSVPLEDFPRTKYNGPGWEMHLRQPNKKKITGQRFWKKIFVRMVYQGDNPVVQLLNSATDKEPFQELPLQACYSVSEVGAQQFDQFGKIFTVKLQYVFYKERPGVRPGQVTKAERITNKLSQFAAYAIQGDYQGVKEFGSDLRKLGLPVEHAPQVSQLFKLGSLSHEDVVQFSCCVEEALFRLPAHRDRALTYKLEEVQVTAVDELFAEQDADGAILRQIARVRVFFLGFLSGMPDVELGVNDLRRQGREVVGRHDIIPVATEEWIRVEAAEFHACVQPQVFADTQLIRFKPPDACYIELVRFRVRPPKNRELPLQLRATWHVAGSRVELRADVLVPGFASRALGQVPCEDVAISFPIPESWIYLFRVEKHFRYGSVKSAHRRTGKIKGIERFLGAVDTLQESLIEVTSGQAKYEHQHRAIVWRMPRLPKEGQGAYTTHNLVCRMALTSYDQIPAALARWARVTFTMPATQVSHTTVRSISLQNHDNDPPEKYVRYLARHEYTVGIDRSEGSSAPAYALATATPAAPAPPAPATPAVPAAPSSDSDSD